MSEEYDPENPYLPPEPEELVFATPRFIPVRRLGGWGILDNLNCTYLKDFRGQFCVYKRQRLAQQVADFQNERTTDV